MKVLLIAPPKDSYMGVAQYPPVGLGYLSTSARKAGHEIQILDCVKEKLRLDGFEEAIRKREFDVAGFTVWSLSLRAVKEAIGIIKRLKPEAQVILGGPHPSALPFKTLEYFPQADFAFVGEGEIGFPKFLESLKLKDPVFSEVPGLVWRDKGEVTANEPAMQEDLDSLGFPSWDLINPRDYFMSGSLIGKDTCVLTCTRGCPYSCTFCSAWITAGKKIRKRSVKNILEEIEYLSGNYGIKVFDIPDENFTFDKDFVAGFCRAVISLNKRFEFFLPNGIRLDTLDEDLLGLMRKAGFRREVAVGIESGSERVLKLMKKNLSLGLVKEKVELLNRAGFRPIGYFILGFPGETKEDMEKTVAFALKLKLVAAAFTPFAPMPGTEATAGILSRGELPQDFDFTSVTTDKVAYAPSGMTRGELDTFRKKALLRFNLRPRQLFYYLANYNSLKFAIAKAVSLFIKGRQVR